jgi:hypothetical protein
VLQKVGEELLDELFDEQQEGLLDEPHDESPEDGDNPFFIFG